MATTFKWTTPENAVTVLGTELNALANGAYSAASAAQDNATDLYEQADFELNVTYGTNPSAGGYCGLYIVYSLDGTNYEDGGGAVAPPATRWVGNFPLRAVTTAQKISLPGIRLSPLKFKAVLVNSSGQAMGASGHTLLMRRYHEQGV